ncbi:hypothetical protein [Streptomyces sp. NPDC085529]|uniref:hypothetical protein n=1 Tax=Streptomyces sp. NPDC085529 TaxID=3365729 RepID=UPI0037D7F706
MWHGTGSQEEEEKAAALRVCSRCRAVLCRRRKGWLTPVSVAFDDPAAWRYCQYCAFNVALDLDTGQMLAHQRMDLGFIRPGPAGRRGRWR